jgi:hypothetical protein
MHGVSSIVLDATQSRGNLIRGNLAKKRIVSRREKHTGISGEARDAPGVSARRSSSRNSSGRAHKNAGMPRLQESKWAPGSGANSDASCSAAGRRFNEHKRKRSGRTAESHTAEIVNWHRIAGQASPCAGSRRL